MQGNHDNDTLEHPAGDAGSSSSARALSTAMIGRETAYLTYGDERRVPAPGASHGGATLAVSAGAALSEACAAFDIGCSFSRARISSEVTSAEKVRHSRSSRQSADVLLKVLGERSPNLHDHLSHVAELAEAVSREHGLPELDVQLIRLAAELHDVGKMAIPDAILSKPGPLSDDEWVLMRRHTLIGERIIRTAASLAPVAQLVRQSHERYDGTGYPDGLRADEIEVGASIIAICDAYDAMVSDRVYRRTMSCDKALSELRRCAGTQFDPELVELFCATIDQRGSSLRSLASDVSCSRNDLTKGKPVARRARKARDLTR